MSCPVCHKPAEASVRPFCSARCREVDLGRWFAGSYAIPAENPPSEEEMEQLIGALEEQLSKGTPH